MIVCTRCGASNQPTSKFCLSCGAPLAAVPPGAGAPAPGPAAPAPGPAPHYAPPGGPPPQPAPQWGAPQPHYAPPPQQQPPQQQPPQQQPPQHQQPPPQQWGGYQQPAPAQAPAPAWGQPPPQPAFAPAEPPRYQSGSPEGLNPFGATVGPPQGYGAPPPGPSPYGPPPQQWGPAPDQAPPPQAWGPPPEQAPPPQAWGPPPPAQPAPPAAGAHSKDPSAYAATAPPPTNEEFERANSPQAPPAAPPMASSPPVAAPRPSAPPAAAAPDTSGLRVLAGFLVSYEATELGVFWPIYQGQNVVGRKGAAPGLDIEIDHPTTSSRHAVLHATARPGRLRIEDPGSTNGTFLGENMLDKNKQHDLRDGDGLRFGGFNVIVKII